MAAIDVGSDAIDRTNNESIINYTVINLNNAANETGVITSVEIWLLSGFNASNAKIGVFYGSGTTYTCRGYVSIGSITSGSKQTFTNLNLPITAGDFIGIYATAGRIERSTSGGNNVLSYPGDQTASGAVTYNTSGGSIISLYGIGATVNVGPANLKSYNTNLKANIKSINTNLIANVKTLDTNA